MNQNRNNLVNRFKQYADNNTPFSKNPLLNNNPNLNMRDSSFYNKMNMAKLEQIKRARTIDDIGIDKKQLSNLIICPIVINKTTKDELTEAYNDIVPQYDSKINKLVKEWWDTRTNQPYKNVIKKELFNKDFKKFYRDDIFNINVKEKKDLLVHKVTSEDWDKILLEAEFELLSDILEKHDKELKVIYSASKENQYKKEFQYVQNYKYRLEYNPKNSEELKDFYKKEQKKINKEKKMIDDVINTLIENDELSKEEIEKLNEELKISNKKSTKPDKMENDLRRELGDEYDEIMENIDISELNKKSKNANKSKHKKTSKKQKLQKYSSSSSTESEVESEVEEIIPEKSIKKTQKSIKITTENNTEREEKIYERPKKKITVKTIKTDTKNTKQDSNSDSESTQKIVDIKDKYRNRK